MSPKLADEARVISLVRDLKHDADATLVQLSTHGIDAFLREAARRELLRRSLAVGVKG